MTGTMASTAGVAPGLHDLTEFTCSADKLDQIAPAANGIHPKRQQHLIRHAAGRDSCWLNLAASDRAVPDAEG